MTAAKIIVIALLIVIVVELSVMEHATLNQENAAVMFGTMG